MKRTFIIIIFIIITTIIIDISSQLQKPAQKHKLVVPTISVGRRIKFRSKGKMPVKILDSNLQNFDGVFEKFRSEASNHKANLILFLADKDPSTNLSWCPDCVRAEPVIYKKLEAFEHDVALLRAYVGDRPTWRNPQHPWRVDSKFKLKGVPTLIRWEDDAVKGRLEDHEAHIETKIDALVASN